MKRIALSVGMAILICLFIGTVKDYKEVKDLTSKVIRLHVVADNDTKEAQELKLKVRDGVLSAVTEITKDCETKKDAEESIKAGIGYIMQEAYKVLEDNGSPFELTQEYRKTYVDRREYDSFTLPAGIYDTLCIKIGSGQGKNWWCVLYPSLCVPSAAALDDFECFDKSEIVIVKEPKKVRYKLFVFEKLQRLYSKLLKAPELKE